MSIEASKWARMADVQKSSSKLVLLELAHLVRFDATDWTVFASIEHLARVTHLNRKTIIEALGRLRTLGVIADTGARAGASRSCPVYRLRPTAVPSVCAPVADAVAGDGAAYRPPGQPCGQPDLQYPQQQGALALDELATESAPTGSATLDEDRGKADDHVASDILYVPSDTYEDANEPRLRVPACAVTADEGWTAAAEHNGAAPSAIEAPSMHAPSAPITVPDSAQTLVSTPAKRPARTPGGKQAKATLPSAVGAGATRLPADWALPARWRDWTHRKRPHWNTEKIDAMALTFAAYWRTKPGQAGYSEDWFASWRLWVFRERETSATAKSWYSTWSGIVAKGRDLGLGQAPGEPDPAFRIRVHEAAGVPLPA